MHVFKGERGHRTTGVPSRKLWHALHEVDNYLRSQSARLVNYAKRYRAGLRVGTSVTEGTANFLVNRRMNKSQQMRWSRRGADLLLQVRCAVYNGALGQGFGHLFAPRSRPRRNQWRERRDPNLLDTPSANSATVSALVVDGRVSRGSIRCRRERSPAARMAVPCSILQVGSSSVRTLKCRGFSSRKSATFLDQVPGADDALPLLMGLHGPGIGFTRELHCNPAQLAIH